MHIFAVSSSFIALDCFSLKRNDKGAMLGTENKDVRKLSIIHGMWGLLLEIALRGPSRLDLQLSELSMQWEAICSEEPVFIESIESDLPSYHASVAPVIPLAVWGVIKENESQDFDELERSITLALQIDIDASWQ